MSCGYELLVTSCRGHKMLVYHVKALWSCGEGGQLMQGSSTATAQLPKFVAYPSSSPTLKIVKDKQQWYQNKWNAYY